MSPVLQTVEAAAMQGETPTNPIVAMVIFATGVLAFTYQQIRRRRKRRGDQEPRLHSFRDNAP